MNGNYLILDNSSLATIKMCATMGKYKIHQKRERTGATAKGRAPGKALHAALELRYKVAGGQRPDDALQQQMDELLAEQMAAAPAAEGDEHLTAERLQRTMRTYRDGCRIEMGPNGRNGIYNFAGYGVEPFDVLWVELPFAAHLGDVVTCAGATVPVYWIGKSDLGIHMRQRGEVMVCDHKTMRVWNQNTQVFWNMASGPKGYAYGVPKWVKDGISGLPNELQAAMQLWEPERERLAAAGLGNEPINGFLLNAIVMRDTVDLSRAKQPPTAFYRHQVFYAPHVLAEWRADTLRWCKSWLDWCDEGQWPMNDAHCSNHFGMSCPYCQVCTLPPEQRDIMLSTDDYEDVTWSPLAVEHTGGAWAAKLLRV